MKPTVISLFSGIGGLDLAAHWAGFETVRFVEKEPFCQKVLAKHWPGVPIDDDVFTSHPGHADVVVGGFPCQPFSVAGKQQGKDDERYLLPEMLRIVREVQPYAVVFENVPGFPALNDGAEFKYLLGALAEMGFDAQWGHLRASDIGAPHQRERWFCVAYRSCFGRSGQKTWNAAPNKEREYSPCQLRGQDLIHAPISGSEIVEHANCYGFQECHISTSGSESGFAAGRCDAPMGDAASTGLPQPIQANRRENTTENRAGSDDRPERSGVDECECAHRQAEPGIRGIADGLPGRLDFAGFPARPGEPQFAYEPARTAPGTKETNSRLKALGNAVVPQVAYPIFKSLYEWFQEGMIEKPQG